MGLQTCSTYTTLHDTTVTTMTTGFMGKSQSLQMCDKGPNEISCLLTHSLPSTSEKKQSRP